MSYSRCTLCQEFIETIPEVKEEETVYKGYCLSCEKPIETFTCIQEPSVTINDGLNQRLRGK